MKIPDWQRWRDLAARKEMRPAWMIACLSFCATILFWSLARSDDRLAAQAAFDASSRRIVGELEQILVGYKQVLNAGRGLLNTRLTVTRQDWKTFVASLQLRDRYPGAHGVGYAVVVDAKDLRAHETAMRSALGPAYDVHPLGAGNEYAPVIYLEPRDPENASVLGLDMFALPARREAMDQARDRDAITATGKVALFGEAGNDAGILLFLPVYRGSDALTTPEARRANLRGFVFSPLRLGDFITALADGSPAASAQSMRIELFDGEPEKGGRLMFDNKSDDNPAIPAGAYKNVSFFEQNGRTLVLRFTAMKEFEVANGSRTPGLVLAIGSALSFLLSALAASLAMRHIQGAEANAQMALLTRELSHRVKNTLAIVQSIANRSLSSDRTITEGREVFTKRLHALARAHTFLLNNGWSGADLRELVIAELSAFGARASVRGPEVRLKPQIAQTFALVVHELATNAVKHGSLSTDEGRVIVAWEIVKKADGPAFVFNWREMGGPPVTEPQRHGFGQTLLRQVFVHGSTREPEIAFAEGGFSYRYEAPFAGILAPEEDESASSSARASGI